jgi:two-component system sensor histidine kinase RegB
MAARSAPAQTSTAARRSRPSFEEATSILEGRGGVRMRSLMQIRWIAVAGQAVTAAVVAWGLDFKMPVLWVFGAIGMSALLNLIFHISRPINTLLRDREAAVFLGFDVLQLTLLLFLTGGISNPFVLLLLAPVAVAGSNLSRGSVAVVTALAVQCAGLVTLVHLPLPWNGPPPALPSIFVIAQWLALTLAILMIALYSWRLADESRRMGDALAAVAATLAHEQRISALGALAAAAAHELGSPLSTISVVSREMQRVVEADDPLREDVDLLVDQAERCRVILARLSVDPVGDVSEAYTVVPIPALVEAAAEPWSDGRVRITFEAAPAAPAAPQMAPVIVRGPEFLQGIGNLVQNACGYAQSTVLITTRWTAAWVEIAVVDDGPGFPETLLDELGAPFLSTRQGTDGHMGLGAFIAKTLLERTGAVVRFGNLPSSAGGGARVTARWKNPVFRST